MKTNTLKILKMALFGLSFVTVSIGIWFTTTAIINTFNDDEYLSANNKKRIILEKSIDVPVKLVEHESDGYYFLGDKGLEMLNQRIKNDLPFGPEVETLKIIRINNLGLLSKDVHGQYNPFTQEIDISISNFNNSLFRDITEKEKVDLIYPTIFHEYGHHFSNTYITSISTNDSRNSKKLFSKSGNKSIHKNIPTSFLNAFEKSLHYSDDSKNYLLSNNKKIISGFKTAKDLYDKSNGIDVKNYSNENDFLGIDELNLFTKIPFKKKEYKFEINSQNYFYYFSIDELITRKLQQISYIDSRNGTSIANNTTSFTGTEFKTTFSASTMGVDISKNRQIEHVKDNDYTINDELILIDYPYGGTFTDEDSRIHNISPTVQNLLNAYVDMGGYNYGISQIYLENTSQQLNSTERNALKPENFKSIKFTGFLDNSKRDTYKALLLNKNGKYEKHNFIKNNYDYKLLSAKSSVLSSVRDLVQPINKFGYNTNYINISNVDLSKPIKIWNDINKNDQIENNEMESLTVSTNRPTTTFRESFVVTDEFGINYKSQDIGENNFYEIKNSNSDAYLQIYNINNRLLPLMTSNHNIAFKTFRTYTPDQAIMFDNRQYNKKW